MSLHFSKMNKIEVVPPVTMAQCLKAIDLLCRAVDNERKGDAVVERTDQDERNAQEVATRTMLYMFLNRTCLLDTNLRMMEVITKGNAVDFMKEIKDVLSDPISQRIVEEVLSERVVDMNSQVKRQMEEEEKRNQQRLLFAKRKQEDKESMAAYLTKTRKKAKKM